MTISGIDPAVVLATAGDIVTAFIPIVLIGLGIKVAIKLLGAGKKAA